MVKVDPVEEYEAELKRRKSEYEQKTTRQKYAKSEQYINFRQGIFVRRLRSADCNIVA